MKLRLNTTATRIDADARERLLARPDGAEEALPYDALVIGTGAVPSARRSPDSTSLVPKMVCTCCTRWTTRSH